MTRSFDFVFLFCVVFAIVVVVGVFFLNFILLFLHNFCCAHLLSRSEIESESVAGAVAVAVG